MKVGGTGLGELVRVDAMLDVTRVKVDPADEIPLEAELADVVRDMSALYRALLRLKTRGLAGEQVGMTREAIRTRSCTLRRYRRTGLRCVYCWA